MSACIIPYAAGRERLLNKNGTLAFHQYSFPGLDQADFVLEYEKDKQYLRSRGIQEYFIEKIFSIPDSDFWAPNAEELIRAGFVTDYADDDQVGLSGVKEMDVEKLEQLLLELPLYAALKEEEPEAYNTVKETFLSAYLRGHTVAEVRKITLPLLVDIYMEKLPYASDAALLGFAGILIEQLDALRSIDPILCYQYAFASQEEYDFSQYFTKELWLREADVGAEIIKSFSRSRNIPSGGEMENIVFNYFVKLNEIYGDDIIMLEDESHSIENQPKVCDAILFFYSSIMDLPSDQSVRMLRYMFSP